MIDQLSAILISSLSGGGFTALVAAIMHHKQNKRLKETEAQLAETNVAKAKIDSKSDEFHLYKEMLNHANERYINQEKQSAEREDYLKSECAKKDARYDEQTQLLRAKQVEINAKDSQLQEEKDLNTEYESIIAELMEALIYVLPWICHKAACANGEPPRGQLKGMIFDSARIEQIKKRINRMRNKRYKEEN